MEKGGSTKRTYTLECHIISLERKKERKKVARISKFKDPILMLNHLDIQIEETLPKLHNLQQLNELIDE